MKILLDPSLAPKGIGLAHNDRNIYPVTGCCKAKVWLRNKSSHSDGYKCSTCATHIPFTSINDADSSCTVKVSLSSFEIHIPTSITTWVEHWTGVENVKVEVSYD